MNVPVYGGKYLDVHAFDQVLKVKASTPASMQVRVNEGFCWVNSKLCEYSGGTITIAPATAGTMVAVVGLRSTQLVVIYGDASALNNPNLPASFPSDFIPLAGVVVNSTTTAIYDDQIQDLRPFFCVTKMIESHKDLLETDTENSHPIAAITGLQEVLDTKLTMSDVNARLENTSTREGTTNTTFTINRNASGINSSNLMLEFKRGTQFPAGIRWNEELDLMEYTDSSGNWVPMDPTQVKDPINQEEIVWKADWAREKAALEAKVKQKADKTAVDDIQSQINGFATEDFVLSQLNGIYSKQQMDKLKADIEVAAAKVNGKVDTTAVYSKGEVDDKFTAVNDTISSEKAAIENKIALTVAQAKIDLEPKFTEISNTVTTEINNAKVEFNTIKTNIETSVDNKLAEAAEKIDQAEARAQVAYETAQNTIAQNNATTIATASKLAGEQKAAFDAKVAELENIHTSMNSDLAQIQNAFNNLKGNTETSVAELETAINTNSADISELKADKANKADVYTKEEVYIKDETYTKEETDANIDAAVSSAFAMVNESLQEVTGQNNTGGSASSAEEVIKATAQLIVDAKAKVDSEREAAITAAKTETLAEAETNILVKAGIESFDTLATKDAVTAVDAKIDAEIANVNKTINGKVDELNTTIDKNKVDAEEALAAAKTELSDSIATVNEAATKANETLDAKIDEKTSEINTVITGKVTELNAVISANKTNIEQALDAATINLNNAITVVEHGYKEADTAIVTDVNEKIAAVNTTLATKADIEDTYTKAEVNQKVAEVDLSENIYTKDEINALMDDKANIKDVYKYTESQVNSLIQDKQLDVLGFIPEDSANKNVANGYPGLDANGKISIDQLPDASRQSTYVVSNSAARQALTGLISGQKAFETSTGDSYIYDGSKWVLTAAANWENVNLDWNNLKNVPESLFNTYGKAEADNKFAPAVHTHTALDITTDDSHMFMTAEQARSLSAKADLAAVYDKDSADSLFVKKTDLNNLIETYTNTEGMNSAITAAVTPKANSEDVYTKNDVNDLLSERATNASVEALAKTVDDKEEAVYEAIEEVKGTVATNKTANEEAVQAINAELATVPEKVAAGVAESKAYTDEKVAAEAAERTEAINAINATVTDVKTTLANDYEKATDVAADIELAKTSMTEELTTAKAELNASIGETNTRIDNVVTSVNGKFDTVNADVEKVANDLAAVDASLADYAKSTEVEANINGAVENINTTLTDYAKSADVTQEINETVNSAISGVLATVNAALEPDDDPSGNATDVAELVAKTATLITNVNAANETKFAQLDATIEEKVGEINQTIESTVSDMRENILQEVSESTVKEVITQEIGLDNITDLATKEYTDEAVATASKTITDTVEAINTSVNNLESDLETLDSTVSGLQNSKQDKLTFTPEDVANKNQINGYPGLDGNGKISLDVIPDLSLQRTYVVTNATERAAIENAISGTKAYETSTGNSYIYNGATWLLQAKADWENVNLKFENIVDAPTTIAGYGITDAYTKTETDNNITSSVNSAVATVNGTINSTKTALESTIAAGDAAVEGKLNTTNSNVSLLSTKIETINGNITTINGTIESINTTMGTKADAADVYTKEQINTKFTAEETVTSGLDERITTLETGIATKANTADVYAKTEANNTFATKTELNDLDKKVDDLSDSIDGQLGTISGNVSTNASAIGEINTAISDINATMETLAVSASVTEELEKRVKYTDVFDANHTFRSKAERENGNYSMLWNPNDGGGSQAYNAESDVISFAGVNTDAISVDGNGVDQAINVQLYAKFNSNKVGTLNYGSRLNVNTAGIYYLKGTVKTNSAEREVAVKADINALQTLIDELTAKVNNLETTVADLATRIETLENA